MQGDLDVEAMQIVSMDTTVSVHVNLTVGQTVTAIIEQVNFRDVQIHMERPQLPILQAPLPTVTLFVGPDEEGRRA